MSSLKKALKRTLEFEGGYSDHPHDKGGATRFGVTQRVARRNDYKGDMKDFPLSLAHKIYEKDYWNPSKAEGITNQKIANYLFDCSVNCGVRTAGKMLQRAYNNLKKKSQQLKVDGKIGNKSLKAINSVKMPWFGRSPLMNSFITERIKYYDKIILKNSRLSSFKRGWYIRAFSF